MLRPERLAGCLALVFLPIGAAAAGPEVPLIEAVKSSDRAALRSLISSSVDVNSAEIDGTTALHWAVRANDLDAAELLIRAGANVKSANRYGVMPLALACINGSAPMVDRLLAAGADANATVGEGETMLMIAARSGSPEVVTALIARGADVNAKERWKAQTALMWAAAEGHADVVNALVKHGADITARSSGGFTPFLFAVREGKFETARALLAAGANVNDSLPSERGAANADLSDPAARKPNEGRTSALILAVMSAHYELAAELLDRGADPNFDGLGYTALHLISWVRKPGSGANHPGPVGSGKMDSLTLVRKLVASGADINARMTKTPRNATQGFQSFLNWMGATPFLTAARSVDAPLMRLLAALGADPLAPNEDHTQPLLVAAGIGVRSSGEDPGTESEILEAVKLAIELGGDVNSVDDNGETVMHGAAVRGFDSLIQLLSDSGAKVEVWNQKNNRGLTPLMMAEGYFRKGGSFQSAPHVAPLFRKLMATAQ